MTKKTFWLMILIAFFVGAVGSIVFNRGVIPYLATVPGLSSLNRLTSDAPIIINRREQVQLDEGINLIELTKQAQAFTVSIFAIDPEPAVLGSGLVLTSDGVIVTSQGVLGEHQTVRVVLNDGRSFDGLVRALDPKSQLAVVTIDANNLAIAQFEDAYRLQVGHRLFALGSTTTEFTREFGTGYVTKTAANMTSLETVFSTELLSETFDTTMDLQVSYSGGPVVNIEGRVVGMTADSAGNIISSEALNSVLTSYLANAKISRNVIGLEYKSFSKILGELQGFNSAGALVVRVALNTPAQASGLVAGDYITTVDNTSVADSNSLERLLNRHQDGTARLTVIRGGEQIEILLNIVNG